MAETLQQPVMPQDVRETQEFLLLAQQTNEDLEALRTQVQPRAAKIFDKNIELSDRIKLLGESLACTLLSHDHRGGYPSDNNGIQELKKHLVEDFGIEADEYCKALGFATFRTMLSSKEMEDYVELTFNETQLVFRGRRFENAFLDELLNEPVMRREDQKDMERAARMTAARIDPAAVEGRLKIYRCLNAIGGGENKRWIAYADVQSKYEKEYGTPLNKAELKKFFGTGEALKAMKEYASDDINITQARDQNGCIYVRLKGTLEEIEERYRKASEEFKTIPDPSSFASNQRRTTRNNQNSRKLKKSDLPDLLSDHEDSNLGGNAIFSNLNNPTAPSSRPTVENGQHETTSHEAPIRQAAPSAFKQVNTAAATAGSTTRVANSAYTVRGDGEYSDEESSDSGPDDYDVVASPSVAPETPPSQPVTPNLSGKPRKIPLYADDDDSGDETPPSRPSSNAANTITAPLSVVEAPEPVVQESPRPSAVSADQNSGRMDTDPLQQQQPSAQFQAHPSPPEVPTQQPPASPIARSFDQESSIPVDELHRKIMHAFIYGILKTNFPLQTPVSNLIRKTKTYVDSQNFPISEEQIEDFIYNVIKDELKFFADGTFLVLNKKRPQGR